LHTGTRNPISLEQYLNTCYDPDVEYVDGLLLERNAGDWPQSLIQSNIIFALRTKYPHLKTVPELRSQTTATRFRLPDVTVLRGAPEGRYLTGVALIAIEILSEADRMSLVMEKLQEYDSRGIPNIWVIDPRLRQLAAFHAGVLQSLTGESFLTARGEIELIRAEIFQA
jgi:Uma2 family endonuclease